MNTHWVIQRLRDRALWTGSRWVHDPIAAQWFGSEDEARQVGRRVLTEYDEAEWAPIEINGKQAA